MKKRMMLLANNEKPMASISRQSLRHIDQIFNLRIRGRSSLKPLRCSSAKQQLVKVRKAPRLMSPPPELLNKNRLLE